MDERMRERMNEPWDWDVISVRCPLCRASVAPYDAEQHVTDHWLMNELD